MYPNIIVVQIDGHKFGCFSEKNGFEKPNYDKALNLMNACAIKVIQNFSNVIFVFGFNDEYSFVLNKETTFYQRRARSYKQSIRYLFVEAGVFWKVRKGGKSDSECAVINSSLRVKIELFPQ
ncbi:tRNA(His) guanylyltransferase 1-like [Solanum pennellii]|uniref:tRNA(His) guanylyltransferase 1-like n=1 Tax=Solanum pennellii TaxID=28526 RepID=A0ABM1V9I9_SOLPN|nr:tRNA(His) guanylyltransferase 1-like [Solanum pennellii]